MHGYNLFGLKVNSELEINLVPQNDVFSTPDATIVFGKVDRPAEGQLDTVYKPFTVYNQFLYFQDIPSIAKYHIQDSSNVTIDADKNTDNLTVQLFFLDSILPFLLIKNDLFPIRAAAIDTPHGCFLLSGLRANGKSTLAAFCSLKGHKFVSDNLCVLKWDDERKKYSTRCYFPYASLWSDVFAMFDNKNRKYLIHQVRDKLKKYNVNFHHHMTTEECDVEGIIMLKAENKEIDFSLRQVEGYQQVKFLKSILYSSFTARIIAKGESLFHFNTNIARQTKTYEFTRSNLHFPKDFYKMLDNEIFTGSITS